jgi:hypothetical protein
MKMKRKGVKIVLCVILSVMVSMSTINLFTNVRGNGGTYVYPSNTTIIPMGNDQASVREAYKSIFLRVAQNKELQWSTAEADYDGTTYEAGTFLSRSPISGSFTRIKTTDTFEVPEAYALQKRNIYIFNSKLTDARGQPITWEYLYFQSLFETYLWGNYLTPVNELGIGAGTVTAPNILIIPSIASQFVEAVKSELGPSGLTAIATFVDNGGTLIAQGDSCWLAEAAGLVPQGTVLMSERVTANNNSATLEIVDAKSPLTFSWLENEIYILDDPLFTESITGSAVARYSGGVPSDIIGSPAILSFKTGKGKIVLTAGHPSEQSEQFPMVLDAVLYGYAESADIRNSISQTYTSNLPWYLIPGFEANVTMKVSGRFSNFRTETIEQAQIIGYVRPGFWVDENSIDPAPVDVTVTGGTLITWNLSAEIGDFTYEYIVLTGPGGVSKGYKTVAGSWAFYKDPETEKDIVIARDGLWVKSSMAARLFGDRDIELDGVYPLPAEGYYFDMAFPIENKEDTSALKSVVVDIVPLVSPVVDVEDQTHICNATGNTNFGTNDPVWVENTIFFYDNWNYPLPDGVTDPTTRFTRADADTTYIYNATGTPIVLPAKRLQWTVGTIGAYDHKEPWIRYGIFSQEEFHRAVSFESDPVPGSVILEGGGGSVYTALGVDSIPYHEYLQSGITYMPEYPELPRVDYEDIWQRSHVLELRTVFYDIVPFPPPEEHAVIASTYEMRVGGQRYLEFPMDSIADLDVMIQSWNGYPPYDPINYPYHMDMIRNETLIRQVVPKGVGYDITYIDSDFSPNTEIADIVETETSTIIYYRQDLNASTKETIMVHNTLENRDHDEGTFKVNDGARFVYRQIAVGPSRYEVHDNHVQVVWGVSNNVDLSNKVSPGSVATYKDEVYQVLMVEEPFEPEDLIDPYIKSYGFGNISGTTYVGGRINDTLLHSSIPVGGSTLIRIEIDNNLGHDMTNISVVPVPPPGLKVVPRWFNIPPIWYDFPFLDVKDIWDAWKGVYYFDVTALPGVEVGKVHRIDFSLKGNNIPSEFQIPEALVGVLDGSGHAFMTYGMASSLKIEQTLPPYVSITDARLANASEKAEFEAALASGDDLKTELAFLSLRMMNMTITPSGLNNRVSYQLPPEATTIPWDDNGKESQVFYVVTRSDVAIQKSGRALYTWAPKLTYLDHFGRTKVDWGRARNVAAHGPAIAAQPVVDLIKVGSVEHTALTANAENDVWVKVYIANVGDDIAIDPEILITFPQGVGVVDADPSWTSFDPGSGEARWELSDLAPYARIIIELKLYVQPPIPLYNYEPFTLIEGIQPEFTHLYLGLTVQSEILGPPALQAPNHIDNEPPDPPVLDPITSPARLSPVVAGGVSEPEAKVNLFVNGAQAASTIADSEGYFSTLVVLNEGLNTITATAFDQFENGPSVPSTPIQVLLDTTSPAAPTLWEITSPIPLTQVTIHGYSENDAEVEVFLNGQSVGFCQADFEGSFSMDVQLVEGENLIMARATDYLGNGPGPWSNLMRVEVDLSAPLPPVLDPIPSMISTPNLEISGTCEPNALIHIYVNNVLRGEIKADNEGSFTKMVPIFVGENTIIVRATDELENGPGKEATVFVLRDIFAPWAPDLDPIESPTDQSTIWITGTSEPLATVEIILGERSVTSTTADSSGIFGVPLLLNEGVNHITARAFDSLGNGPGAMSETMIVVCDTIPPMIPRLEVSALVTVDSTTVSGISEPFSNVEIFVNQESKGKVIADYNGKFEMDVVLIEGMNLISARAEDQLGNIGPLSQSRNVCLDTTPPKAFIDLVNPGSPKEDSEITLVGSGIDSGTIVAYQWDSDLDGSLGSDRVIKTQLSSGNHLISFKVQDEAGHWSESVQIELEVEKVESRENPWWFWTFILTIIIIGIVMVLITEINRRPITKEIGPKSHEPIAQTQKELPLPSPEEEEFPPPDDEELLPPPDDEDWPPPPPDDD